MNDKTAHNPDALKDAGNILLAELHAARIDVTDPYTGEAKTIPVPVTGVDVNIGTAKNGEGQNTVLSVDLQVPHADTIYYDEIAAALEAMLQKKHPELALLARGSEGSYKTVNDYSFEFKIPGGVTPAELLNYVLNPAPNPVPHPGPEQPTRLFTDRAPKPSGSAVEMAENQPEFNLGKTA